MSASDPGSSCRYHWPHWPHPIEKETSRHTRVNDYQGQSRRAGRVLVVAPMTFMMTQQRTRTICNPELIAIFKRLEKIRKPIRFQGCEILSFHWIRETVQVEVIIMRPNFQVNISGKFTIREFMGLSFEGSVNMDL